jgi:FlgD Ig-like domain
VFKLDGATGEVLWFQEVASNGGFDESVDAIAADAQGNAFVTGRQYNGIHGDDILTMKLAAADGEVLWTDHDGGADELADRGWAIAVGPDGHPVVTGVHSRVDDPGDYRTIKLDSADGTRLWGRTVPGAVNTLSRPAGWLAVCEDNSVLMVSRTFEFATSYDIVLQHYAADDGGTLWTQRYNSGGNAQDDPTAVVRAADGDLLVAGLRAGNFLACRFDDADGSLVWEAEHDGPAGGYDAAAAVAEGPAGEVIVTGFGTGAGTGWDAMTAAFGPADGALLWDACFDPGDGYSDEGRGMAVSAMGDLYVTGVCERNTVDTDLMALRYLLAPSTGVAPLPAGAAVTRVSAFPNPATDGVVLSVETAHAADTRIGVYDLRGRRVASLHDGRLGAGAHRITWSGRGPAGAALAAGVYFVRLEAAGETVSRKLVLRPR